MKKNNSAAIYYRTSLMDNEELIAASEHFECFNLISNCPSNKWIIGRYSMYPFYLDQQKEIENMGSKLINNYSQHMYIADLKNYINDLKELTPQTWNDLQDLPENMSFVLKGETNSRKSNWKKDMFASNKQEAIEVFNRLSDDSLISYQKIYIREYVPLVKYMDGINGMPVTKEFRFFVAFGKIISGGYYWQNYIDDLPEVPDHWEVPTDFLLKVINRIGNQSNFYTIDVGQTQSGEWIVIELNDGQQAGLSCNEPKKLYERLSLVLEELT